MTKIAFEDFERQVVQHHLIKGNVYENGAALVERANRWIAENGIDVLNVESLSRRSARGTIPASATGTRASGLVSRGGIKSRKAFSRVRRTASSSPSRCGTARSRRAAGSPCTERTG